MGEQVRIEKLVTGGQGLGVLEDGRKVFVWNALPGELVDVEITADKHSYAEAIATNVIEASDQRVAPKEDAYLATSPWQIIAEEHEDRYKIEILQEQFTREHLDVTTLPSVMVSHKPAYGYRNKVEFGFVEVNSLLQLAVTGRRSHEKIAVAWSALARPELNQAADDILRALRLLKVNARDLSHLTLRCSLDGKTTAVLTIRTARFVEIPLPPSLQGLQVRFVNGFGRRHQTKTLQETGNLSLTDELMGLNLRYAATSFFQVNLPMYERALQTIRAALRGKEVTELYAGVGSIGLTCGAEHVTLVDIDRLNTLFAEENLHASQAKGKVVTSSSEKALDYIVDDTSLIVDPPRAGLSPQVLSRILSTQPPQVIYLSCDPATLARDLAKLQSQYAIQKVEAYNFFPRTPHIETLVILQRQK